MLSRCESRHRSYTELCNRSSTSSLGLGSPLPPPSSDILEDYWEDASVSLRSCHSWEASPSPWFGSPAPHALEKFDAEDACKGCSGSMCSGPIWPRSRSFDASEYVASHKPGRRSFPPPLASCSTLSIKGGGRFVLKEMDDDRPQGFFRVQRGNGRLRLELVLPDEVVDEEESQEEISSPVEDMGECVEWDRGEHSPLVVEAFTGTQEECFTTEKDGTDEMHPECGISGAAQEAGSMNLEIEGSMFSDEPKWDVSDSGKEVGLLGLDSYLTDNLLAFSKLELNQFVPDSSTSHVEQEPLWNVDARQQALAALNPWSANQICVHQSITRIRPALGLAMS